MDSDAKNAINIYNEDGSYIKFVCVQNGLYYINLNSGGKYTNFLTTIAEQKDHVSDVDNKRAILALSIQKCLCLPSNVDLVDAIDKEELRSMGMTEGTTRLPMSSLGLSRPRWKESVHRERTRCPVIVV